MTKAARDIIIKHIIIYADDPFSSINAIIIGKNPIPIFYIAFIIPYPIPIKVVIILINYINIQYNAWNYLYFFLVLCMQGWAR